MVFRLPAQLTEQLMLYNSEDSRYEALQPAQALVAEQLAMLLPAAVAMQVRLGRLLLRFFLESGN